MASIGKFAQNLMKKRLENLFDLADVKINGDKDSDIQETLEKLVAGNLHLLCGAACNQDTSPCQRL